MGMCLLQLACEKPATWAAPALIALEFTCRLISIGALPRAFVAEILATVSAHVSRVHARHDNSMLRLALSRVATLFPNDPSCPRRTAPVGHLANHDIGTGLPKPGSTPVSLPVRLRSVGTSLSPQDEK